MRYAHFLLSMQTSFLPRKSGYATISTTPLGCQTSQKHGASPTFSCASTTVIGGMMSPPRRTADLLPFVCLFLFWPLENKQSTVVFTLPCSLFAMLVSRSEGGQGWRSVTCGENENIYENLPRAWTVLAVLSPHSGITFPTNQSGALSYSLAIRSALCHSIECSLSEISLVENKGKKNP